MLKKEILEKIKNLKTEEDITRAIKNTIKVNIPQKHEVLQALFKKKSSFLQLIEGDKERISKLKQKHGLEGLSDVGAEAYYEFTHNKDIVI